MVFPIVSLKTWLAEHKYLKIMVVTCRECGTKLESTVPFIDKNYVGVTTPPCPCGNTKAKAESMITRTESENLEWQSAF